MGNIPGAFNVLELCNLMILVFVELFVEEADALEIGYFLY